MINYQIIIVGPDDFLRWKLAINDWIQMESVL